jgi:hypothetical protein
MELLEILEQYSSPCVIEVEEKIGYGYPPGEEILDLSSTDTINIVITLTPVKYRKVLIDKLVLAVPADRPGILHGIRSRIKKLSKGGTHESSN